MNNNNNKNVAIPKYIMCDNCKLMFLKTIRYGEYDFCDNCVKAIKKYYGKAKDRIDIITPTMNGLFENAAYKPNGIEFRNFRQENLKHILECISHEAIHYVLHKRISIKVMYDFDNLAHRSDIINLPEMTGIFLEEGDI